MSLLDSFRIRHNARSSDLPGIIVVAFRGKDEKGGLEGGTSRLCNVATPTHLFFCLLVIPFSTIAREHRARQAKTREHAHIYAHAYQHCISTSLTHIYHLHATATGIDYVSGRAAVGRDWSGAERGGGSGLDRLKGS